eukprot:gene35392-43639_t
MIDVSVPIVAADSALNLLCDAMFEVSSPLSSSETSAVDTPAAVTPPPHSPPPPPTQQQKQISQVTETTAEEVHMDITQDVDMLSLMHEEETALVRTLPLGKEPRPKELIPHSLRSRGPFRTPLTALQQTHKWPCPRCGERTHSERFCPTTGDPAFDPAIRLHNVPRNGRKVVHEDGLNKLGESQLTAGLDMSAVPEHLKCALSGAYLREAVSLPCCKKCVNDSEIRQQLVTSGLWCPLCSTPDVSPEMLLPRLDLRDQVEKFIMHRGSEHIRQQQQQQMQVNVVSPSHDNLPAVVATFSPQSEHDPASPLMRAQKQPHQSAAAMSKPPLPMGPPPPQSFHADKSASYHAPIATAAPEIEALNLYAECYEQLPQQPVAHLIPPPPLNVTHEVEVMTAWPAPVIAQLHHYPVVAVGVNDLSEDRTPPPWVVAARPLTLGEFYQEQEFQRQEQAYMRMLWMSQQQQARKRESCEHEEGSEDGDESRGREGRHHHHRHHHERMTAQHGDHSNNHNSGGNTHNNQNSQNTHNKMQRMSDSNMTSGVQGPRGAARNHWNSLRTSLLSSFLGAQVGNGT